MKTNNTLSDDTPETDEAQFGTGRVSVEFARRLERERNKWKDLAMRMRPYIEPEVWMESSQIQYTLDEYEAASLENAVLADFINREMRMDANDPRIEELKKRLSEEQRFVMLLPGDPVERYGFFRNLTFVEESGGHVTIRDHEGNEKRVYTPLFLKHAKFKPNHPTK